MRYSICSLLAVLTAPHVLPAQSAPATIPIQVASVALSMVSELYGGTPKFVVNRLPEGWPRELSPTSAMVIGGIEMGALQVAVFNYGVDTTQALASFRTTLEAAGWREGSIPAEPGGFQVRRVPRHPLPYCKGPAFISLTAADTSSAHSLIVVRLFTGTNGMFSPVCGGGDRTLRLPVTVQTTVPTLAPPPNVKVAGAGTSSSGGDLSSEHALLSTSMTPEQVVEHYGKALERDGWRLERLTTGDGTAMRRVSKQEKERQLSGLLTAYRSGPDIAVQIQTKKERSP